MENNRSYRIRTSMDDKVVPVDLSQDVDVIDVLSLKLRMADAYRLHSSSYGILMGRVLANDAFGVPNAKVSVFVAKGDDPIDVSREYPYATVTSRNRDGVRYNLLHDGCGDACHADVGTFPNKRRVLDNDTDMYVYDTYYKFVTSTNSAGDYMLYGVPTGVQQVHVDVDLSDIGVLSQRPSDMVYKGYDINRFENPSQFKTSKNLNDLPQVVTKEQSVNVYPFFGDSRQNEIAISRCDIHIDYKFEPTCVFIGSAVTDNAKNSLSNRCRPSRKAGYNRNLTTASGTIEMIRKTPGGYVEEYNVNGGQLIDSDGVWCYQIPMNLDYVGTDEYGNMVPTDDPKKGIPTRSRVRFRISLDETGEEGISRHRAKMLVPSVSESDEEGDGVYEFGSATEEKYFRDLYWNKVYSIKSYVPRLQKRKGAGYDRFCGLKKTNDDGDFNPIPFNTVRVRNPFVFAFLCSLAQILDVIVTSINVAIDILNVALKGTLILSWLMIPCVKMSAIGGDGKIYAPGCGNRGRKRLAKNEGVNEDNVITKSTEVADALQGELAEDFDVVNMDFSNDWLNGCVYLPLFHYKGRRKWTILGIPFTHTSRKRFCSCDNKNRRLKLYESCSLEYSAKNSGISVVPKKASSNKEKSGRTNEAEDSEYKELGHGVVKEFMNRDGLPVYYYQPYQLFENNKKAYLYGNDLILLGSLNDCDIDGIPQLSEYIPSTTSNVPEFYAEMEDDDEVSKPDYDVTGIDWGSGGNKRGDDFRGGYFTNIKCTTVHTNMKTCINAERLCELGVGVEVKGEDSVSVGDGDIIPITVNTRGTVTSKDIFGEDARSVFATLNSGELIGSVRDKSTGYLKYDLSYVYTNGFDGTMTSAYKQMKQNQWSESSDPSYIKYRFGGEPNYLKGSKFPIYKNSFYFYFGLRNGATAMDKLKRLYYADCRPKGEPTYDYGVTAVPDELCSPEPDGRITLSLSGVKGPCDIEVYFNGIEKPEFGVAGYDGTEYEITGLSNGEYTIVVEDVNGIRKTRDVSLSIPPINVISEKRDLGFDYTKHKENGYGDDYGRFGYVKITGASIYGNEEIFKTVNKDGENVFLCTTEDGKKVRIEIEGLDMVIIVDENGKPYIYQKVSSFKDGKTQLDVTVSVKLVCEQNDKADYSNTVVVTVYNGYDFVGFINSMPVEYMVTNGHGPTVPDEYIEDPGKWKFPDSYTDESWKNYVVNTEGGAITAIDVEKAKFDAITSVCGGVYDTDNAESITMTTFGGTDTVYAYGGPDVDYPEDDGTVTKVVEARTNSAYINPDIPLFGYGKTKNPSIKVSGQDNSYFFAAATNGGDGEFQTIPNGINPFNEPDGTKKKKYKCVDTEKFISVPYIDKRIILTGRNNEEDGYVLTPMLDLDSGKMEGGVFDVYLYGGAELAYRKENIVVDGNVERVAYEVIGEGLEWSCEDDGSGPKLAWNPNGDKKLYSVKVNEKDVTDTYKDGFGTDDLDDAAVIEAVGCSYGMEAEIVDTTGGAKKLRAETYAGGERTFRLVYSGSTMEYIMNKIDEADTSVQLKDKVNVYVEMNGDKADVVRYGFTVSVSNRKYGNAHSVWKPFIAPGGKIDDARLVNPLDVNSTLRSIEVGYMYWPDGKKRKSPWYDYTGFTTITQNPPCRFSVREDSQPNRLKAVENDSERNVDEDMASSLICSVTIGKTTGSNVNIIDNDKYCPGYVNSWGFVGCVKIHNYGGKDIKIVDRSLIYDVRSVSYNIDKVNNTIVIKDDHNGFWNPKIACVITKFNEGTDGEDDDDEDLSFDYKEVDVNDMKLPNGVDSEDVKGIYLENGYGFTALIIDKTKTQ